ncbi:MAG: ABC transporter permease, partial [Bryobacteraceae bacterium]
LLRPLPYEDPDRIVVLWEGASGSGAEHALVTPANYADWIDQNSVFRTMAFSPAYGAAREFNLQRPEGNERIRGAAVSSALFPLLGVRTSLGRSFSADEDRSGAQRTAILSHALWIRLFGGRNDARGSKITLDSYGLVTFEVVGVMPPGFSFPDQAELWIPVGATEMRIPPPGASQRCCRWLQVFARLKDGVTIEQARAQMSLIQRRLAQEYPASDVSPEVSVIGLQDQIVGPVRLALYILQAAVIGVLLIACANVANLLLARAASRQKEIVVRSAIGAGRGRILQQLLTESAVIALLGGAIGFVLALGVLRLMATMMAGRLPRLEEVSIDAPVLGFALALSMVASLIFGLAPVYHATRIRLTDALREGGRGGTEGRRRRQFRGALVVMEVGLAVVLVICAGLFMQSLVRLHRVDPGFHTEGVLTATIDMSSAVYSDPNRRPQAFFDALLDRLRARPGVAAAGGIGQIPLSGAARRGQGFMIQGRAHTSDADLPSAGFTGVTPDAFRALGMRLVHGRLFSTADGRETSRVAVVSETLARRYWPGYPKRLPIGERIVVGGGERKDVVRGTKQPNWREIVGVVSDVRGLGLDREPHPEVYLPHWQWPWHSADLTVRTGGDPRPLAAALRGEIRALDRNAVLSRVRTMEEVIGESVAQQRLRSMLLGLFAGVGLLLAAVGIFGVMSYAVAQRTHEIGIRMALGAEASHVRWKVVEQGLGLTLIGVALGLGTAFGVTRMMSTLLFGVTPTDWVTFVGSAVVLSAAALAACYLPARRATRVDPIIALRHE